MLNTSRSFIGDVSSASASATAATTAATLLLGATRDASPWAPLNAVSHILWGDEAALHTEPSAAYTATGAALNGGAMVMWATAHASLRRLLPPGPAASIVAGATVAAAAYVTDYYVVPKRLTPGFEKRLSGRSMFWIYAALAAGLAASSISRSGSTRAPHR
ncbi:MAG TPA: hypothetical protein VNT81_10670 [Vicinamibacterales bacterium]|nr:hypothetical protein [Vicinamibacterales bacterium]